MCDQECNDIILLLHLAHHGACLGPSEAGAHHNGQIMSCHIVILTKSSNSREVLNNSVESHPWNRITLFYHQAYHFLKLVWLGQLVDDVEHPRHHLLLLLACHLVVVRHQQHQILCCGPRNQRLLQLSVKIVQRNLWSHNKNLPEEELDNPCENMNILDSFQLLNISFLNVKSEWSTKSRQYTHSYGYLSVCILARLPFCLYNPPLAMWAGLLEICLGMM